MDNKNRILHFINNGYRSFFVQRPLKITQKTIRYLDFNPPKYNLEDRILGIFFYEFYLDGINPIIEMQAADICIGNNESKTYEKIISELSGTEIPTGFYYRININNPDFIFFTDPEEAKAWKLFKIIDTFKNIKKLTNSQEIYNNFKKKVDTIRKHIDLDRYIDENADRILKNL